MAVCESENDRDAGMSERNLTERDVLWAELQRAVDTWRFLTAGERYSTSYATLHACCTSRKHHSAYNAPALHYVLAETFS